MEKLINGLPKNEYYRLYQKEWRKNNPDKIKEKYRKYNIRRKTEPKLIEWYKEYYREYNKKYKRKNKKIILTEEQREKKRERDRKYSRTTRKKRRKERYSTDIRFKLDSMFSRNISKSLNGNKKGKHWEILVGYTVEELKNHLESMFEPWMNWNNHGSGKGKWNIDHIKPKSLFNYTSSEDKEFKNCWSLENLQPLDAIENYKKSNNYGGCVPLKRI